MEGIIILLGRSAHKKLRGNTKKGSIFASQDVVEGRDCMQMPHETKICMRYSYCGFN